MPGDEVDVVDPRGQWLGRGLYSPGTAILARLYSRNKDEAINRVFFEKRIACALKRREVLGLPSERTDAYRIINGEGDDLPGFILDRYGNEVVVQLATLGLKLREGDMLAAVDNIVRPRAIIDRTSAGAARTEGFAAAAGVVSGSCEHGHLKFRERGFDWEIPLELGQKTGYYLDQRTLRGRVEQMAGGRSVLDVYSYVGPFALAAARGGAAHVTAVDSSALALEVAADAAARNGLSGRIVFERDDAFDALKRAGRSGGHDIVICDPPRLAATRSAGERARSLMRRIASAGCQALRPGGFLVLCSCSAALGLDALTRELALGAREVNVVPRVVERWYQGFDHPVLAAFPEGLYLSAVIAEITSRS
jgi:23S rRNA (cytosine1962-C5)-methyltransferase